MGLFGMSSIKKLVSSIRTSFEWSSDRSSRNSNIKFNKSSSPTTTVSTISTALYEPSLSSSSNCSSSRNSIHYHTPLNLTPKCIQKSSSELLSTSSSTTLAFYDTLDYDDGIPASTAELGSLPTELVILISNIAGFTSALKLGMTCKRLNDIIMNPLSWRAYTNYSQDIIESKIYIMTKLSTFDNLLFGVWPREQQVCGPKATKDKECLPVGNQQVLNTQLYDSVTTLQDERCYSNKSFKQRLFFEHRAYSNHFDFLGGVEVDVHDDGKVDVGFFEHLEKLPCQQHSNPEATIDQSTHICHDCYSYKRRRVLENFSIPVPRYREMMTDTFIEDTTKPAFEWIWESANGLRRVIISINPHRSVLGYAPVEEMPCVVTEGVVVNGMQLQGKLRNYWNMFVQCRNTREEMRTPFS